MVAKLGFVWGGAGGCGVREAMLHSLPAASSFTGLSFCAAQGGVRKRHSHATLAPKVGLAIVLQMLLTAGSLEGGMRNYAFSRSLRADSPGSSERALRASSRGVEGEHGEEEDSPSMTLNLPNDVHGGTSGYPIPMGLPDDSPGQVSVWIRYFYQGGKLTRDGKLLRLRLTSDDISAGVFKGDLVLDMLRKDGVDLLNVTPMAYQGPRGVIKGWVPLTAESTLDLNHDGPPRVDVQIFRPPLEPHIVKPQEDGFFTIGVLGGKTEANIGTLWRSAHQLDAAGLFVIGSRYRPQSSDVVRAQEKIPLIQYPDWNTFCAAAPYDAKWVAIEMGGEPLETFEHPARAVYILGSEDNGLPSSVLKACHCHVALPSINYASYNVAVAGSLVMYDRVLKQVWGGAKAKRDKGVSTPSPWRRRKEVLDAQLEEEEEDMSKYRSMEP